MIVQMIEMVVTAIKGKVMFFKLVLSRLFGDANDDL